MFEMLWTAGFENIDEPQELQTNSVPLQIWLPVVQYRNLKMTELCKFVNSNNKNLFSK